MMKELYAFGILLGLCGLVLTPHRATAATFFASSVAEIQSALTTAANNGESDAITIAAGEYRLSSSLEYDSSENYALTIQSDGGSVTLDGSQISNGIMRVLSVETIGAGADVTIDGITLYGGFLSSTGGTTYYGAGLYVMTRSGDITLRDCLIDSCRASALFFSTHAAGAYLGNSSTNSAITVEGCRFENNSAKGTAGGLYINTGSTSRIVLVNNIFHQNESSTDGGGAYIKAVSGTITLTNNTFTANTTGYGGKGGGFALCLYFDSATANVYNTIAYGNAAGSGEGGDIYIYDDLDANGQGAAVAIAYSDFSDLALQDGDAATQSNNLHIDPGLNSQQLFYTRTGCVDAGTATAPELPSTDIQGQQRIQGAAPDMGADEYDFAAPVPALSPVGLLALGGLISIAACIGLRTRRKL